MILSGLCPSSHIRDFCFEAVAFSTPQKQKNVQSDQAGHNEEQSLSYKKNSHPIHMSYIYTIYKNYKKLSTQFKLDGTVNA